MAFIRRRLVSYEVLPLLKIGGIAWELRCLNESSVAHHQPEMSQTSFDLLGWGSGPHSAFANYTLGDLYITPKVVHEPFHIRHGVHMGSYGMILGVIQMIPDFCMSDI
jgi:hypothetical protein